MSSIGLPGEWGNVAQFQYLFQEQSFAVEIVYGGIDGARMTAPRYHNNELQVCSCEMQVLTEADVYGQLALVPSDISQSSYVAGQYDAAATNPYQKIACVKPITSTSAGKK